MLGVKFLHGTRTQKFEFRRNITGEVVRNIRTNALLL